MEVKASDILIPRRANALSKKIQEYNRLIGTNPQRVTELYVNNDCGKIGEWIDGLRVNHKCYGVSTIPRFFIPRIIEKDIDLLYLPIYLEATIKGCRIKRFVVPWIARNSGFLWKSHEEGQPGIIGSETKIEDSTISELHEPIAEWMNTCYLYDDWNTYKRVYKYNLEKDKKYVLSYYDIDSGIKEVILNKQLYSSGYEIFTTDAVKLVKHYFGINPVQDGYGAWFINNDALYIIRVENTTRQYKYRKLADKGNVPEDFYKILCDMYIMRQKTRIEPNKLKVSFDENYNKSYWTR